MTQQLCQHETLNSFTRSFPSVRATELAALESLKILHWFKQSLTVRLTPQHDQIKALLICNLAFFNITQYQSFTSQFQLNQMRQLPMPNKARWTLLNPTENNVSSLNANVGHV